MAQLTVELSDEEQSQLDEAALARQTTPDALVTRWIRERLVHERERASGGGRDMSPRSRRAPDGVG